jgi:hypothetical protein
MNYRAVCLSCDYTTYDLGDPESLPDVPNGNGRSTTGVYRAWNGVECLNCAKCKEPKHAIAA